MQSVKVPIAYWQDSNGNWTAFSVDGEYASALGSSMRTAGEQVKKYLEWLYAKQPWLEEPNCLEPKVSEALVELRPRHQTDSGMYPGENPVHFQFKYVWGKRSDGSLICCLPTLDKRFFCHKETSLRALVVDQVQRTFADATANEVATSLFARDIQLDTLLIRVKDKPRNAPNRYPLKTLPEIALALGDRWARKQFSTAWRRNSEVNQLQQLIVKRKNVLLVGPASVGKSTVLVEAIRQIRQAAKKNKSKDSGRSVAHEQRYWMTNASRIIAGMKYLGQWEQRCEQMIDELSEIQGLLCIENLLALIKTGSQEPSSSVAAFMKHFMMNGELRMIAETTKEELETIRRLLPGFDSMFEVVHIQPMQRNSAIAVLSSIAEPFEKSHKIEIDTNAVALAFQLFQRFLPYDSFPGKCVIFWKRLLDRKVESLAVKSKKNASGVDPNSTLSTNATDEPAIRIDDVVKAFVAESGLPEFLVRDELLLKADEVETHFANQVIGQPVGCAAVTDLIMTFKAAMNDPARPIGVHFFCGPTGVGKTELAKSLSRYLFGSGLASQSNPAHPIPESKEDRLIRLDMSEFGTAGSAERLVTRPDGRPSEFIEKVRRQPFVVILLDEIEKAAPEIFDALMNVFDEGRLTDRMGRVTNFCSCVIIMTSNLGTSGSEPIGFDEDRDQGYEKEVRKFFRPEFFNRIDQVVTFNHLTEANIQAIAEKEIRQLTRREGLDRRNIQLEVDDQVVQLVARLGYDRKLGARPLQRVIEQQVVTPLARWIAENTNVEFVNLRLRLDREKIVCEPIANRRATDTNGKRN